MKDYKRLTERDEFGNADIIGLDSNELACALDFDGLNKLTFALNKLASLEDKIESGELISTVQSERGEQEIAFFVKHNAEVRKQAVIEFAERVKMAFYYEFDELIPSIMADKIDELVKEVCGDD